MSSRIRRLDLRTRHTGNAIAETLIALLALAPLIAGIPLLQRRDTLRKRLEGVYLGRRVQLTIPARDVSPICADIEDHSGAG